jgi:hypothetical protein
MCADAEAPDTAMTAVDDDIDEPLVMNGMVESVGTRPDVDGWSIPVTDTWDAFLQPKFQLSRAPGSQSNLEICITWANLEGVNGGITCPGSTVPNGCCGRLTGEATYIDLEPSISWSPSSFDGTWHAEVRGSSSGATCETYTLKAWF